MNPKWSLRYERERWPDVETSVGSWNDVSDRIELDCAGKKTTLFSRDVQGAHAESLRMYYAPEKALVLVEWTVLFRLEGDGADSRKPSCCRSTAPAPRDARRAASRLLEKGILGTS